ncbi:winged helix-turn-helix transcriptional regulator [Pyxidicoccus fallax]|uniref:Winged helix-turn-helix transcriptional regulator n=1 Tax=Pyxidicoccus fallax TaxID=394095 RepID=A0A848LZV8_9BACT|nr:MarR family winged helix-turn-helix transcriptional regulator [Pyxidicoccus fallax]NMO23386.1 winged helix-turn-helix transcriptional regulator [Pyxidicoccus fallax]NPC86949.1 winged helix-turn-helix transcriptional regulator [Pyxidicoccus fallax]
MSELSMEVRVQVARLRNLIIDLARCGSLNSPLGALPHPELDPMEVQAIWWLKAESLLPVNVLADRLGGIAMPRLSRLLDRLEDAKLVQRERSVRHDRRRVRVRLTEQGRALAEQADSVVQERMARLLLPLGGEQRSELVDLLEKWVEAMGCWNRAEEMAAAEETETEAPDAAEAATRPHAPRPMLARAEPPAITANAA